MDTLETFVIPDRVRFTAPNGITLSGDERRLYVAFVTGIAAIDLATRAVTYLTTPPDVATGGADGLAWNRGSLIAVQTMPTMERIVRLDLDEAGMGVTGAEVVERWHSAWRKPTTGVVVGDAFYYVSASGYDRQGDDGTVKVGAGGTEFRRVELRQR